MLKDLQNLLINKELMNKINFIDKQLEEEENKLLKNDLSMFIKIKKGLATEEEMNKYYQNEENNKAIYNNIAELQKQKTILQNALILKNKVIYKYIIQNVKNIINENNLNGVKIDKRKLKKLEALINENESMKAFNQKITINFYDNLYINFELEGVKYNKFISVDIWTVTSSTNEVNKKIFDTKYINFECVIIKKDNYYIKLAKNLMKKEEAINKKIKAIEEEVKQINEDLIKSDCITINDYLSGKYHGSNNLTFFKDC